MTVIRRLDALPEPTKPTVLAMKAQIDAAHITNQHAALCQAVGEAFYNISSFTLRDLKARTRQQQFKDDFEYISAASQPTCRKFLIHSGFAINLWL